MSRPKMVSVPGGGGGGTGPRQSGACIPTRCGSASGPRRGSSWRLEPAALLAVGRSGLERASLWGPGPGQPAARGAEGQGTGFQWGPTWLQSLESRRDRPLAGRHSPLPGSPGPPMCSAAGPTGPGLTEALPGVLGR